MLISTMHEFTILVAEGAFASAVAATLDLLSTAQALAPRLQLATPSWRVCALRRGPVRLSNGLSLRAEVLTRSRLPDHSVWIIPGLTSDTPFAVDARLRKPDLLGAIPLLQSHVNSGGSAAASCSAVFLLQAAGLLRGRKATTTWWLAAHLQSLEPDCRVDANRMLIADGPIWTAGAAFAHIDLMLQLLRERCGPELAEAVARALLIDGREAQAPYIVPALLASGNALVAELVATIEAALPDIPSVAALARALCISERTLARRIQVATGKSPSALIQFVRLKRARFLLETSQMSVDRIAETVGYRDATALRRLMRTAFAATPRQFRKLVS
jgi:transcriptional regulator GlxA family with amidase domain